MWHDARFAIPSTIRTVLVVLVVEGVPIRQLAHHSKSGGWKIHGTISGPVYWWIDLPDYPEQLKLQQTSGYIQ